MTSKDDRQAYEHGQKDAEAAHQNPIGYVIGGPTYGMPSDPSQREAYSRGCAGQRLDHDKK